MQCGVEQSVVQDVDPLRKGASPFADPSSLFLSSLELSDPKVYEPYIRARLGIASYSCDASAAMRGNALQMLRLHQKLTRQDNFCRSTLLQTHPFRGRGKAQLPYGSGAIPPTITLTSPNPYGRRKDFFFFLFTLKPEVE